MRKFLTNSWKAWATGVLASCLMGWTSIAQAGPWLTDFETAKRQAQQENKMILMDFTGSDWCGWCIRLKNEVFDQPDFIAYANQNLILLEIDFPRKKPIGTLQLENNQALAKQFRIEGYPTIVIAKPDGKELGRTGYRPGGPKAFIAGLQSLGVKGSIPTTPPPQTAKAAPEKPTAPKPLFGWLTGNARAPKADEELKLKGIAGTAKRRMALINTETLAVGDDARVPLGDKTVRVHCLEIKETSVIIRVDYEENTRELHLGK